MKIVIEIGTRADDEVYEPALHQLDHAAAQSGRRRCAGDGRPDGRVVLGQQHLLGENPTGLSQACGVEGLKALINQPRQVASARTVILYRLAAQVIGTGFCLVLRENDGASAR